MKRYNLFLIALMTFLYSCNQDLMSYEGKEAVYFAVQHGNNYLDLEKQPFVPYSEIEFVKLTGDQTTVDLKVAITGEAKNYDRKVDVRVNPDSTNAIEGVHYQSIPNNVIIEAGKYFTYVPIAINRTVDMETDTIKLGLKLLENEDFKLTFEKWGNPKGYDNGVVYEGFDASYHTLYISDILVQPAQWMGSVDANGKEGGELGAFTAKKFNMICEYFDLTYNDFMNEEIVTYMVMYLINAKMSKILIEAYEAGEPYLENDGRLMYFGGCPWDSYIGVPWEADNN